MSTSLPRSRTWTAPVARVVIHHLKLRQETDTDAYRFVRAVLREIRFQARVEVSSGLYTTGRLARSIQENGPFVTPGVSVTGEVGSDLPYAAAVEKGARPHHIFPNPPRTTLKFFWRRVGRVVHPRMVRHPGMRGKGYLAKAARIAARRHNMLLIIYDV